MSYLSASTRCAPEQCSTSGAPGLKPGEVSMGTSIMAVSFKGGVILGVRKTLLCSKPICTMDIATHGIIPRPSLHAYLWKPAL